MYNLLSVQSLGGSDSTQIYLFLTEVQNCTSIFIKSENNKTKQKQKKQPIPMFLSCLLNPNLPDPFQGWIQVWADPAPVPPFDS